MRFAPLKNMIMIIVILYLVLNYILEMEKEELYKFMVLFSLANLLPLGIYTLYTSMYGGFDLLLMMILTIV